MDKKSYDNGSDFSFVEQKVREVQTTIENAVKTSNYQELNQSITRMVLSTLKQYQKEHPATVQKKTEHKVMNQKIQETHPELYGNTGGEKVKDILLIVFGGLLSGSMAIGLLTDSAGCNRSRRYHFDSSDVDWYTGRCGDDLWRLYRTWQIETLQEICTGTWRQNVL